MPLPGSPSRRQLLAWGLAQAPAALAANPPAVPLFIGTGPPSNRTPQMLDWLAQKAGLRWRYQPTPWLRAQELAAAGDGVMYGLARTRERERVLLFSQPVWSNFTWAVVPKERQHEIRRYADLAGQPVCWARGSAYGDLFTAAGLGRMLFREAADDGGALRMVGSRRCVAALLTLETAQAAQALAHPALASLKELDLALVPQPMTSVALHFATGRDGSWAWVIDQLNRIIARHGAELERQREG